MPHAIPFPPPGFDSLTPEQQFSYACDLWEHLDQTYMPPLPDWQIELLNDRLAEHKAHPERTVPWETVKAELEANIARRRAERR